jgi:acyl-CoA reductase-like NAD-dependent aldehyde dehydrogenase
MAPSATNDSHTNGDYATIDYSGSFTNTINGKSLSTSKTRHGTDPVTSEALWEVPLSGQEEVDEAVKAARAAFKKWSKVPVKERQEALLRFADALEAETDKFAELLSKERGGPVSLEISSVIFRMNEMRESSS